jgi:hypothetical protein
LINPIRRTATASFRVFGGAIIQFEIVIRAPRPRRCGLPVIDRLFRRAKAALKVRVAVDLIKAAMT